VLTVVGLVLLLLRRLPRSSLLPLAALGLLAALFWLALAKGSTYAVCAMLYPCYPCWLFWARWR
jgi:hypothetical protein